MELKIGSECREKTGTTTRPSTVNIGGARDVEMGCGCVGVEPTWQTVQDAASLALLCVCQRPVAATMSNTANIAVKNISGARRDLGGRRLVMAVAFQPPFRTKFYTGSATPSRSESAKLRDDNLPAMESHWKMSCSPMFPSWMEVELTRRNKVNCCNDLVGGADEVRTRDLLRDRHSRGFS